jgi:ceramide glucosyltransferase
MTSLFLTLLAASLLIRILLNHRRMRRMLGAPDAAALLPPHLYPSLTLVRPIKGQDVGYEENTRALLAQDYPGEIEILFVFDSTSDPAYPRVAQLAAESGKNARVVFAGPRPVRRTGKLNAMISAFDVARGELLAFCDSDARPTPDLVRRLVEGLLNKPEAGAAFAPAVTMGAPESFAEVVYGLMINSWYGAAAADLAGAKRELPFIMGQAMVLRRDALEAIGGLEAAEGQLVDDMYLGAQLHAAGYKNVMVHAPLHLVAGPLGLRELSSLLRKWMTFSRSGLPAEFVRRNWLRGIDMGLALAGSVLGLLLGEPVLAALSLIALSLWVLSHVLLYRALTGVAVPLRFAFWVPAVVPFVVGSLLVASRWARNIEWRGQSYALNDSARLAAALSPAARARLAVVPPAPPSSLTVPAAAGAVGSVVARVRRTGARSAR